MNARMLHTRPMIRAGSALLALGAVGAVAIPTATAAGGKLPGTITIGSTLPLTGTGAPYGQSMLKGLTIGLKDAEADLGGTKLKLKSLDSQALAGPAVTQARSLATQQKVPAIVTAYSAPPLAQLKIAEQYKVPLLNGGGNTPDLPGHTWLFNDAFMVEQGGFAGMKYAVSKLKAKKTSILIDTNYPKSTGPAYQNIWKKLTGQKPRVQFVPFDTTDAGPQIDKMLADKPDVMFISVGGSTLSLVLKQLAQRGVKIPMVSNDGAVVGAPEAKTVPFKIFYANPAALPSAKFKRAFKAKYGGVPDFLAIQNYNLGRVIGAAIKMVNAQKQPITGANIQKVLNNPKNKFPADGGGTISFTPRHIAAQDASIIQYVKGASKVVATGIKTQ